MECPTKGAKPTALKLNPFGSFKGSLPEPKLTHARLVNLNLAASNGH